MKKLMLNVLAMFMIVWTATSCDKESMIEANDLPAKASTFVSEHFSNVNISHVKKEKEGWFGVEHDVYLADGTEITFDKDGNWRKVEGAGNNPISTGFILAPIVNYVKEKYPNTAINSIEKDRKNYDVELANDLDLVFDANGNFVKMD